MAVALYNPLYDSKIYFKNSVISLYFKLPSDHLLHQLPILAHDEKNNHFEKKKNIVTVPC